MGGGGGGGGRGGGGGAGGWRDMRPEVSLFIDIEALKKTTQRKVNIPST